MTAVAVDTYSHGHFQRLPTLEKARADYLQANGDLLVEKTFKDFFVEAGMETTFGLVMLHRHFDIMPEQKMVEYRGTSSPWVTIAGMTELKPTVWAFDEDTRLRPTEFRYTREDTREVSFGQAELRFIASLREKLVAHGLMELFGLARYPGDDFPGSCEITQGSANINLHPNDYPDNLVHIPTIWWFSEPLFKRGCRCTCNASARDHPHGTHVITRSG